MKFYLIIMRFLTAFGMTVFIWTIMGGSGDSIINT